MMTPTIHLNGTSAEELLEQYRKVLEALREAHRAMAEAAPHGRDYYVQGTGAPSRAIHQHVDRLKAITELIEDYERLAESVIVQESAREARKAQSRRGCTVGE